MPRRIPKQERPNAELLTAVLDEARERASQLHREPAGRRTDQSVTPPHGDPERAHIGPESGNREVAKDSRKRGIDPPEHEPAIEDPKTPRTKPQGTTDDQIANMENEGPGPAEGPTDNRAGG